MPYLLFDAKMPKKRIFETEMEEYLALKNKTKNQKTIGDGIIMPEFVANMMQDGTTKQEILENQVIQ